MSAADRRARRGSDAERHVERLVLDRGWQVLDRNFRTRGGEIDLIALDGDILVFIEVRARTGDRFGLADDSVDSRKLERVMNTALEYIVRNEDFADRFWRVDLFAVSLGPGGQVIDYRHYENLTLD